MLAAVISQARFVQCVNAFPSMRFQLMAISFEKLSSPVQLTGTDRNNRDVGISKRREVAIFPEQILF